VEVIVGKVKVSCWQKGKGQKLLFLHGWAESINKEKYLELLEQLAKRFEVLAIDFPGFGKSSLPSKPWTVEKYSELVVGVVRAVGWESCMIAGHSFGGRVAIKIAAKKMVDVKKLILISSAGVERKSWKVKVAKFVAGLVPASLKKMVGWGSADYRRASGVMRETMKLVVAENLESDMAKIKVPTQLIWGSEDGTTPLWQARIINSLIEGSQLAIIDGGNHGIPYRRVNDVLRYI